MSRRNEERDHRSRSRSRGRDEEWTDARLASEFNKMFEGSCVIYPNPIMKELRKQNKKYVECESVLVILSSDVDLEEMFNNLQHSSTIAKVHIFCLDHGKSGSALDMARFASLYAKIPQAKEINIQGMKMKNFKLKEMPQLRKITVQSVKIVDRTWDLNLPHLTELRIACYAPPEEKFAQSLIQCPSIETFYAHKYWHDEKLPKL